MNTMRHMTNTTQKQVLVKEALAMRAAQRYYLAC